MAEFNVKTIDELQQLSLTDLPNRLDESDYLAVYQKDGKTTNKISLQTLKKLTLSGKAGIGADTTYEVENTNLEIGKAGIFVDSDDIGQYFEQNGIKLKVGDNPDLNKITAIKGEGVSLVGTELHIIQGTPSITVKDANNNSFNLKDAEALSFTGAVSVENNEIHINDKDTVLQAITTENPEGINISKIKAEGVVNFSVEGSNDTEKILTVNVSSSSESATKAFGLKVYTVTGDGESFNFIEEDKNIANNITQDIFAVYFQNPITISPTTIEGKEIAYYYKGRLDPDKTIISQIINKYAILQPIIKNENNIDIIDSYKVIFADNLQAINDELQIQPVIGNNNLLNIAYPNKSYNVLTEGAYLAEGKIDPSLIDFTSSSFEGAQIPYQSLINLEGQNQQERYKIPREYIPNDVGSVTLVDGCVVQYEDTIQTLNFTNANAIVVPQGDDSGSSTSYNRVILAHCTHDPTLSPDQKTFILEDLALPGEGLYLIKFDYGLSNVVEGVKLQISTYPPKYIYYDGKSSKNNGLPANLITDHDTVLFYFDGNETFYLISVDNAVGERIQITNNDEEKTVTLTQGGTSYVLAQTGFEAKALSSRSDLIEIDDSSEANTIVLNFKLPDIDDLEDEEILDKNQVFLNGNGEWEIPSNSLDNYLPPEEDEDNPEYDRSKLYLNGEGNWVSFLDEAIIKNALLDLIYPVNSYYYTSNPNFTPNGGQSDPTVTQSEDWTGGQMYVWEGPVTITEGSTTIYRWHKIINENFEP